MAGMYVGRHCGERSFAIVISAHEIRTTLREEIKSACEYHPFEKCDYSARIANEICVKKLEYIIDQLDGLKESTIIMKIELHLIADITLGIAVGSSTQILMFMIPFSVVVGWMMGKPMDLNFQLFEMANLFIIVLVVAFLLLQSKLKSVSYGDISDNAKCKLLHWSVDGVVAEGQISSTNPKVKVHYVPLGGSCWKVWIDRVFVEMVDLIRPNDEIFFL